MRINTYVTELDQCRFPYLAKERGSNYKATDEFTNPQAIVRMINELFHADRKAEEYAWIVAFDTKMHPLGVFELSHGCVNGSIVNPREIFIRLCLCGASCFVLIHNHPTGVTRPRLEDSRVTERISHAGNLMGIPLRDHIIVGSGSYYSFMAEGTMPKPAA